MAFQTLEDQREIWSPLPNQGWKPCLKPTRMECEYCDLRADFRVLVFLILARHINF